MSSFFFSGEADFRAFFFIDNPRSTGYSTNFDDDRENLLIPSAHMLRFTMYATERKASSSPRVAAPKRLE